MLNESAGPVPGNQRIQFVDSCGVDVHVDGAVDELRLDVVTNFRLVDVYCAEGHGGIHDDELLSEKLDENGIVASGLSEGDIESGHIPCSGEDTVAVDYPCVLRIGSGSEHLGLLPTGVIGRLLPTQKGHKDIVEIDGPYRLPCGGVEVYIRVGEDYNMAGGHVLLNNLDTVLITYTILHQYLRDFAGWIGGQRAGERLHTEDNLVDEGRLEVLDETLVEFFGSLGLRGYIVLLDEDERLRGLVAGVNCYGCLYG